jgi:hypothetical protein
MRILRIRCPLPQDELMKRLDPLDAVAVRDDIVSSLEEFGLAEHLAKSAFSKKTSIARQMRYEFLLWLSGKTDIKSAMRCTSPRKKAGADEGAGNGEGADGSGFFVVVFSDTEPEAVCRMLGAKRIPLGLEKKAEPLALERISISRII